MKKYLLFLLVILFLFGCSQPVQILKFIGTDEIKSGESAQLSWEVINSENVSIDGIGSNLSLIGTRSVQPDKTTTYTLTAEGKDGPLSKSVTVNVKPIPPPPAPESPKVTPEVNNTETPYLSGLIPIESVPDDSKFFFDIFTFDRTNYPDRIDIYLTVKDKYGNFIANLAPPYGNKVNEAKFFKSVAEEVEGQKNLIIDFTVKECHDTLTEPYDFAMVLDHSGSMYPNIDYLQNAARKFIQKKKPEDRISVVKFDYQIYNEVPLTSSTSDILDKYVFDGLKRFGGATALYAAADAGINTLDRNKKNKSLILFTDGLDNVSWFVSLLNYNLELTYKPSSLIFKAREEGVKIFTIGIGQIDKNVLEKIAALTDGKFYYANNGAEIEQIYSSLPRMFKNYYVVSYKPTKLDGSHNIAITGVDKKGNEVTGSGSTYVGKKFSVENLDNINPQAVAFYRYKESNVDSLYIQNLNALVNYMKKNPNAKIEVQGHTDSRGTENFNKMLSEQRAKKVKAKLVSAGINSKRVKAVGYGFSHPIWNPEANDSEANENRRVEIIITD